MLLSDCYVASGVIEGAGRTQATSFSQRIAACVAGESLLRAIVVFIDEIASISKTGASNRIGQRQKQAARQIGLSPGIQPAQLAA